MSNTSPATPIDNDDFIPVRNSDTFTRKNPDGTIAIVKLDDEQHFFVLDGICGEFWSMIDSRTRVGAIKKALAKKHSPPAARFADDVHRLVKTLRKHALILP